MISIQQIDAALGLLGMRRNQLADALSIKVATLNAYFTGQSEMKPSRNAAIQEWFENAGLLFTRNGGVDVRKDEVVVYAGQQGFISFMQDVLQVSKQGRPDICVSNVNELNWQKNIGDYHQPYIDERSKLNSSPSRILVKPGDTYYTASQFAVYREAPVDAFTDNVSFYAYGDKLALIDFEGEQVKVLVLRSADFAKGFRSTFNYIWENSREIG